MFLDYVSGSLEIPVHTNGEGDVSVSFDVTGISEVIVSFIVTGGPSQPIKVHTVNHKHWVLDQGAWPNGRTQDLMIAGSRPTAAT